MCTTIAIAGHERGHSVFYECLLEIMRMVLSGFNLSSQYAIFGDDDENGKTPF